MAAQSTAGILLKEPLNKLISFMVDNLSTNEINHLSLVLRLSKDLIRGSLNIYDYHKDLGLLLYQLRLKNFHYSLLKN
jgi:hypothetical protein